MINMTYRHLLRKIPFMLISGGVLLLTVSCAKNLDGQAIPLAGKWAKVDNNSMTTEFIQFRSGEMKNFVSNTPKVIYEGTIWNSKNDFKEKSSERYSVIDGILTVSGKELGKVSVNGNKLTLGNITYEIIYGVTSEEFSRISLRKEEVICTNASKIISVGYKISNPLPNTELTILCAEEWIKDLTATENAITFRVTENDTGETRIAVIKIEYPGADAVELSVVQKHIPYY